MKRYVNNTVLVEIMEGDHIGMVYNLVLPYSNLVIQLQMTRTEEVALLEDSSV